MSSRQILLGVGLAVWASACFALMVYAARSDTPWLAPVAVWLASPVIMFVLRVGPEGGVPGGLFDYRTQSWAFLFGDLLFLSAAAYVAARGWREVSTTSFYYSVWWIVIAATIGILAGFAFHVMDTPTYAKFGMELALNSPTKWAHDFVAYPVLCGGLFYLIVPTIIERIWPFSSSHAIGWGAAAFVGVLLWVAMGARDATAGLDPANLHSKWDTATFKRIP